ncbi:MAG: DMT family transporter [Gammaproteobacteria bacterium]
MASIHIKLVAMGILWATSYPLGRYVAHFGAPEVIVLIRAFTAFLFLALIARQRGELHMTPTPAVVGLFVVLGLCGFCGHNLLMFTALEHTQANTGAVINGAIPVVVVILDFLIFRRTIARLSVLGIGCSFLGAALVVTHGDLASILKGQIGYGELLFVGAITAWAIYTIAARPLLERLPVITVSAYGCLAGTILLVPFTLANAGPAVVLLSEPPVVLALVVHGLLTMGLGFVWYYEGVRQLGTMNAAAYTNLIPIFGVALAAVTIGEIPDAALLLGGSLVVGGLWIVNRAERARAATAN